MLRPKIFDEIEELIEDTTDIEDLTDIVRELEGLWLYAKCELDSLAEFEYQDC